jgi:signal transduction histidine kinase/CheY-like chemotaxis protein
MWHMGRRIHAATILVAFATAFFTGAAAAALADAGPPLAHRHPPRNRRAAAGERRGGQPPFARPSELGGSTRVEIFAEELDTIRFPAAALDAELVALLKKKHSARPPHIVVAFTINALAFAERHHEELWPAATLIFMGINERELSTARGLHAATGVVLRRQTAKTIELGLHLLPRTSHVVLVGGVSDWDRRTMALAKEDMVRFAGRLRIEYLENMPFAQILKRVQELREGSLLLPISMFRDSGGQSFVPSDAFTRLSEAAAVPNLSVVSTRMGRGMLGGHLLRYRDQGREAGQLTLEILGGRDARSLPVRVPESGCVVDWRQLRRWSIPLNRVPAECEIRYREYTLWEQHWATIVGLAAIILLQAALISVLVLQHRRRRLAEREAQSQRSQLAHAARLATVGELTASIAHEINQPLGAILSNADAAEILLESPEPDLAEVRQILADIRRDDERASAVIQRLRTLLARHELDWRRLDPNAVAREAIALISQEADRRGARLVEYLGSSVSPVKGDRVHLVQVMIILLMNALDAMEATPPARRQVVVSTADSNGMVEMAVRDAGAGIPAADFSRLFDSFFTTKEKGMGLGLSIARSIVEAHGGMIWAENTGRRRCRVPLPAGSGGMTAPPPAGRRDWSTCWTTTPRCARHSLACCARWATRFASTRAPRATSSSRSRTLPRASSSTWRMPEVGGLEIQDALARLHIPVPIIFLTGHGDIPMSVKAMRGGASDFLTKPVKREQIVAAVSTALERHAAGNASRAQRDEIKARYDSLTVREREVFHGVVAASSTSRSPRSSTSPSARSRPTVRK